MIFWQADVLEHFTWFLSSCRDLFVGSFRLTSLTLLYCYAERWDLQFFQLVLEHLISGLWNINFTFCRTQFWGLPSSICLSNFVLLICLNLLFTNHWQFVCFVCFSPLWRITANLLCFSLLTWLCLLPFCGRLNIENSESSLLLASAIPLPKVMHLENVKVPRVCELVSLTPIFTCLGINFYY